MSEHDPVAVLIAKAPAVSEETVAAIGQPVQDVVGQQRLPGMEDAPPPPEPILNDDIFDPERHERDKNGIPIKTKDGKYRRKRGGGAKKSNAPSNGPSAAGQVPINHRQTAQFLCGIAFGTATTTLGKHWEPSTQERTQIEDAAYAYALASDMRDIPPGIALIIVAGLYAMPRIAHPDTLSNVRQIGESLGIVKPKPRDSQPERGPQVEEPPIPSNVDVATAKVMGLRI